ncbi:MAG: hypothetical protein WCV41_04815, partial [Patescibacteria group bacterium]
ASLQFYEYMVNPKEYPYQAGQTYTFTNPYSANKETVAVTPVNQATAGLYNYTPHVYNGNYNFWKLWNQYFTRILIDGSLVQADGEIGVWLIQDGKKRPFLSKGALTSRYDVNKIITIKKADLDGYAKGAPIRFAQYSIVRSPMGDIYLLVDDTKRKVANLGVFRELGFNPEELENAGSQDLADYSDGAPITADEAYPTGALLKDPSNGGVYFVIDGTKAPLIDPIFLKTKFKNYSVVKSTAKELAKYEKIAPVKFEDGYLLKSTSSLSVFVVSNGKKRPIASAKAFEQSGYKWNNILTVKPQTLALYDNGEPIGEQNF